MATPRLLLHPGRRANRRGPSDLYLNNHTIKTHVNRIFGKTGTRDRAAAIGYAHRRRIG